MTKTPGVEASGDAGGSAEQDSSQQQSSSSNEDIVNSRYTFDLQKLEALRSRAPWKNDPKYFKKVAISPSAVTKMMMHCQSGVTKGIAKGGRPIEVMGLLLGRADPATPQTLVLSDAFPLSLEGFETSVVTDNDEVFAEMIRTSESIDRTRHERIMGWYHSHPFDVGAHSHCFLSGTDHQTQLHWQRSEDPNGNPWLAVVIDPLRSLAKKNPELKAFRAYPPDYSSPQRYECPDGSIVEEEQARLEMWGKCWDRYYELEVEYFMSAAARRVMAVLTQTYLWMTTLGSTPTMEAETKKHMADRINSTAAKMKLAEKMRGGGTAVGSRSIISAGVAESTTSTGGGVGALGGGTSVGKHGELKEDDGEIERERKQQNKEYQGVVDLAVEKLHGNIVQATKQNIFY